MRYTSTRKARAVCIVCALSSLAALFGVQTGSFTNHAGHAVSGALTSVSNGTAVISGRAYPLSAFPDAERARMMELLGAPQELPAHLHALRRSLRDRALRAEALAKTGAKKRADADAARARLAAMWSRALDLDSSLSAATRDHWRTRLMSP